MISNRSQTICGILDSWQYHVLILVLVLYSLFAYNIARCARASDAADPWLNAFFILCISVFTAEIVLNLICRPKPMWFVLALDVIATLSILVDLSWVAKAAGFQESNGSHTSQAAIVSARAGRIVRLLRLLRLLRTVSLLTVLAKNAMRQRKAADAQISGAKGAPSNIGSKLTDALVLQVALAIIATVILTALLTSWAIQPSPYDSYVWALAAQSNSTRNQLQPDVDALLSFSKNNLQSQRPLTLRVGSQEWNWVQDNGGWPGRASAAVEFTSSYAWLPNGSKIISSDGTPTVSLVVDVSRQDAHDALVDILLVLLVLIVMLVYVAALNVTIYRTLVRPLERIFNAIRTNAAQIVAALGSGDTPTDQAGPPNDEEDGDIATIEAAVLKMSRILAHASISGRQGTHLARDLAVGADHETQEWLATMVGDSIKDPPHEEGGAEDNDTNSGEVSATNVQNEGKNIRPASGSGSASGAVQRVLDGVRNVRFSVYSKGSPASSSQGTIIDALEAATRSPTGTRLSGVSLGSTSAGATPLALSRPHTGSFGGRMGPYSALAHDESFAEHVSTFGIGLSGAQRQALLDVDLDMLHSFQFDVLSLPKDALTAHVVAMFLRLDIAHFGSAMGHETIPSAPGSPVIHSGCAPVRANDRRSFVDVLRLWRFVDAVSEFYRDQSDVPYHNFYHCVDVTHATFLLLDRLRAPAGMTPLECFAVMVAALAHDMDHPGVNNAFLVNMRDTLALTYNDASVLENRHVACLYALVTSSRPDNKDVNIFIELSPGEWKEVRRLVIAAVLHTDMTLHFPMVSKLEVFLELHAADIATAHTAQRAFLRGFPRDHTGPLPRTVSSPPSFGGVLGGLSAATAAYSGALGLPSVFSTPEERLLLLCAILHAADISNPARSPEIAAKWSDRVLAEFFSQGDRERSLGQPISPMCDRSMTSRPGSQINFLDFIVTPLFSLLVKILPDAGELLDNAKATRHYWHAALIMEFSADRDKTEQERRSEIHKAEAKAAAFNEKYKDTFTLVSKRRRDMVHRLSSLPSLSGRTFTGTSTLSEAVGTPGGASVHGFTAVSLQQTASMYTPRSTGGSGSRKGSGTGVALWHGSETQSAPGIV